MKTIQVGKARSLLPNSSPEILTPFAGPGGTFQVLWVEAIDAHGLFFQDSGSDSAVLLATHHNGYSCRCLGERINEGDPKRISGQVEYIRRCGGTAIAEEFLPTPCTPLKIKESA